MSTILINWLNEEVRLSNAITNLDEDFRNGYLLGELLHRFNQIKNFALYKNTQRTDDIINNYLLLEPSLVEMGEQLSSREAIDIILLKPGVADSLVYKLKIIFDEIQDPNRVIGKPSEGVIAAFPKIHPKQVKEISEQSNHRIFEQVLRMSLEPQNHIYLRKIEEPFVHEQIRQQVNIEN